MKNFYLLPIFIVFTLASCAPTKLTEAQKASLERVTVSRPAVQAEDLKPVDGSDSPGAANKVPMVTGGGIIPALIGSAIDAGVTAHQSSQFKKQYGTQIEQVQARIPRNPGSDLRERGVRVLKKDSFFGTRLTETDAPNRFDGDLVSYGLVRYDRNNDQTTLGMDISCNVWLTDANSKKLFTQLIIGRSKDSYTIPEYAAKPALVDKVYLQALDSFEAQFKGMVDSQLGR
jgi:hypothetical protein